MDMNPLEIKNHLWVFINCFIVNPTFDSQTKEHMTSQVKSFGSECVLTDKFIAGVLKCGIVETLMVWAKTKEQQTLQKAWGKKQTRLKGIPKLEDAIDAGNKDSIHCTLILTEGDSAKALAVSGLGVIGRDRYGVFPLRGRLLNVREASHKQILENFEINTIIKITGLQYGKKYETIEDMKTLRYGKIMIMTDQDQDGSHIKGLLINFLHFYWPSLLKMNFIEQFITPLIKATNNQNDLSFFSIPEFDAWKRGTDDLHTYNIKYYKGLGTSDSNEAIEYFRNMERHRITFKYTGEECDKAIQMVLFTCLKRNDMGEMKVAQLAGSVAEQSAYHHGEVSLMSTIINLAHNYVGSNNINLLQPLGQFGTRLQGGKDAASPRYIFTKLNPLTRLIFHPDDDPLLKYLNDDNLSVEPQCGHWLVVIVCFPGLTGPVEYQPKEQIEKHSSPKKNLVKDETQPRTLVGKARRTRSGCYTVYKKRNSKEANDCDTDSDKTTIGNIKSPTKTSESILGHDYLTSNGSQPIKQPCILVFDSSPKPRRTEVVEVIRDYLKVEYKVKHGEENDFSSMKFCKPEVPTRQDSACCGLYMLVYADSFFNNPIVDYRLPIKHLSDWFPLETMAKKREEIDRFVPDLSRAPSKPLDSLGAVAVLEDCNTSQDVTNDFCGFDLDQPLHGLLSADRRTDHFLNDDDDNAVMDVIERPVTPTPTRTPTPQLCVTLSRCSAEYVPPAQKKKRGRRRTAAASTALKTLSTVNRKILGSEKPIATRKRMVNSSTATRRSTVNSTSPRKTPGSVNSTSPRKTAVLENSTTSPRKTASPEKSIATRKTTAVPENSTAAAKRSSTFKKNEPANNPAKKGKKPAMKRRSLRRRKPPPPKSVIILRSASNKAARGKDNSTLIPLRKHVVNEYWKNIQKQDKQNSRRCSK